jgi:hypothetical protein
MPLLAHAAFQAGIDAHRFKNPIARFILQVLPLDDKGITLRLDSNQHSGFTRAKNICCMNLKLNYKSSV